MRFAIPSRLGFALGLVTAVTFALSVGALAQAGRLRVCCALAGLAEARAISERAEAGQAPTMPSATAPAAPATGAQPPNPNAAATAADHKNMMEQLGIAALRPGPSGNESAPNHANYDESLANPYPSLPDALTLRNGNKVTSAEMWWKWRRPEIMEDFDREVLGRVPRNVPAVAWRVSRTEQFEVGGRLVVGKELIGTVDNSAFPQIDVEVEMTVVTPANAATPVPVMMMFGGRSGMPPVRGTPPTAARAAGAGRGGAGTGSPGAAPSAPADPPATSVCLFWYT
jgi:hypothetical protein